MDKQTARVGGLSLPEALVDLITSGRWNPPANMEDMVAVFADQPDGPHFYDLPTMATQNRLFQQMSQADVSDLVPSSGRGLGIAPDRAVIIGDLGVDMPFALDYRVSESAPRVIYLGPDGWREVASDFASLSERLGLAGESAHDAQHRRSG